MKIIKYVGYIGVFLLSFLLIVVSFDKNTFAQVGQCGGGCEWVCYFNTDNQTGNTSQACYCPCDGGAYVGSCPAGYYVSNDGCTQIGTGNTLPKDKGPCEGAGPYNCPAGTVVDYSQPIGAPFCATKDYMCGSPLGTGQSSVGCCHGGYSEPDCEIKCKEDQWGNEYACKKVCYGEPEFTCYTPQAQNYACVSLAPPHSSTVTYSLLNPTSATNCSASAGYMGKEANNIIRINADVPTTSQSNALGEIRVWLGSTPPVTDVYSTTITQRLASNSQVGFAVKKSGSSWLDIYAPTIYNTSGVAGSGIQAWTKIGTVGSGLRGEINGATGLKIAGISNVSVSTVGTNTRVTFELTPYNESSGITNYEKMTSQSYSLHATPKYITTSTYTTQWPASNTSVIVDLMDPVNNSISVATVNETNIDVAWSYSDALSGIKRVNGDASITGSNNPKAIDDTTSGVNNYVFGSGATSYDGTHLWTTSATSRTDRIDLNDNRRGTITFTTTAFDNACNRGIAQNSSYTMAVPWVISKGGSVFGGNGIDLDLPTLTSTSTFSNDSYWNSPFSFTQDKADYTSELSSASSASVSSLLYPDSVGTFKSLNHFDNNNKQGFWYDRLLTGNARQMLESPTLFNTVNYSGNATLSSTTNSITNDGASCTANKTCVVKVAGNLTLNNGFTCNSRATFFVEGTVTLNPEITVSGLDDGCIIVSRGNITINEGTYKSGGSTYPKYDILEAMLVTDGQINIGEVDAGQSVKDGLLVHGSLISFGSTSPSLNITRALSNAHNQTYPAIAIHFDNRYLSMAATVFGGEDDGYRREVGFKPL